MLFLILSGLLVVAPVCAGESGGREVDLRIGSHAVRVEVAITQAEKECGLMGRTELCPDCGMLFVFETPDTYAFWMKNTLLPLSIAFIGPDGRILNLDEMQPNTLDSHKAHGLASYALEMRSGWFAAHGVKPGDKVQGLGMARQDKENHHGSGKR